MINSKLLNGKSRIAVSDIADLIGLKPYIVKQCIQKLVNNRMIESPHITQGKQWIDEDSFLVLSERLGVGRGYHVRIVEAFNDI